MKNRKNSKGLIIVIIALIVAVLGLAAVVIFVGMGGNKLEKKLELAQQYLDDEDYEMAVAAFLEALEIDPNCVEAYRGAAKAYEGLEEFEEAMEILEEGYDKTSDSGIKKQLKKLEQKLEEAEEKAEEGPKTPEDEVVTVSPADDKVPEDDTHIVQTDDIVNNAETETASTSDTQSGNKMTAEEALRIIDAYCHDIVPLDETDPSGEMHYIEPIEAGPDYVVIDFRSYTGSHTYYTVDLNTGIATIEEYVPAMDLTEDGGTLDLNQYR